MPSFLENADCHIIAIVAHGRNREIGKQNGLLWHLPDDLRRFKTLTMGCPILMGRKTWDSLPRRPLPGRINLVITSAHRERVKAEGADIILSMEEAHARCKARGDARLFVIGGAQVYAALLPWIDALYVTYIDREFPEADVFFPAYEADFTCISEEPGPGCLYREYHRHMD